MMHKNLKQRRTMINIKNRIKMNAVKLLEESLFETCLDIYAIYCDAKKWLRIKSRWNGMLLWAAPMIWAIGGMLHLADYSYITAGFTTFFAGIFLLATGFIKSCLNAELKCVMGEIPPHIIERVRTKLYSRKNLLKQGIAYSIIVAMVLLYARTYTLYDLCPLTIYVLMFFWASYVNVKEVRDLKSVEYDQMITIAAQKIELERLRNQLALMRRK